MKTEEILKKLEVDYGWSFYDENKKLHITNMQRELIQDISRVFSREIERLQNTVDFNVKENMNLIKQIGKEAIKEDATVQLLDDIISWEKDLSEYKSLEGILREQYKITKR